LLLCIIHREFRTMGKKKNPILIRFEGV
jgi:hypothetical protein